MKRAGIILALIVAFAGILFWLKGKPLDNVKAEDIQEIYICDSLYYFTITEQEDIQTMLEALNSPDVKRDFVPSFPDGYVFEAQLRFTTGKVTNITILSNSVAINKKYYTSSAAYCDSVGEVFHLLSKTYPTSKLDF